MYQHPATSVGYYYCCGTDVEGILRLIHVSTPGDKCRELILLWNGCGGILRLIHVSMFGDKCRVLILLWNGCGGYLEVDTCINTR